MIGHFLYSASLEESLSHVLVAMRWTMRARRGRILVSEELNAAALASGIRVPDEEISLESAFSFGLYLAMQSRLSLILTGDMSAWDDEWGPLIALSAPLERH